MSLEDISFEQINNMEKNSFGKKVKAPNGRLVTVKKDKKGKNYIMYTSKKTGKRTKKYLTSKRKSKKKNKRKKKSKKKNKRKRKRKTKYGNYRGPLQNNNKKKGFLCRTFNINCSKEPQITEEQWKKAIGANFGSNINSTMDGFGSEDKKKSFLCRTFNINCPEKKQLIYR